MIRRIVLAALAFLLCSCVAADGQTYYATTQQEYYGMYIRGGLDSCVLIALTQLEQSGVELTEQNELAVAIQCENIVRALFRYRYQDMREPFHHGIPGVTEKEGGI